MAFDNSIIENVFKKLSNENKLFIDTDMYNIISDILTKYKNDKRVSSVHANLYCVFKWMDNTLNITICDKYLVDAMYDIILEVAEEVKNRNIQYVKRIHTEDADEGIIHIDINPNYFYNSFYINTPDIMKGKNNEEIRVTG